MNLRPYAPGDWVRLWAIHDAARLQELQASGLAAAFLRLEQAAENEGLFDCDVVVAEIEGEVLVGNEPALALYLSEGFTVQRRVDGKLAGNEAFAASGYVLQRTAIEGLGPSSQDTSVRR